MQGWVPRDRFTHGMIGLTLSALSLVSSVAIAASPTFAETLPDQSSNGDNQLTLAEAVAAEMNRLRTDPAAYATWLESVSPYYNGQVLALPGEDPIRTCEGVGALQEAIAVLRAMKPLPSMTLSSGMSQAAQDHVVDTGAQGIVGSAGTDGSSPGDRAKRYGTLQGGLVELLSYGKKTPTAVVLQLLINDGDPNRGLRGELLNPKNHFMGVACGSHASRGAMCVIEASAQYAEKSGTVAASKAQSAPLPQPQKEHPKQTAQPAQKLAPVAEAIATPTQPKPKPQSVAKKIPAPASTTLDSPQSYLSPEEQAIFDETNRVRANPAAYAIELENLRQYFDGNLLKLPGQTPM